MGSPNLHRLAVATAVLLVAKGDTVKFLNHDTVAHNVYSPDGEAYNLGTFKPNEDRTHVFDQEGAYTQLCSIHPEMLAFIYVAPNHLAAAVDAKGHYAIKDVPPGTYKLATFAALGAFLFLMDLV